MPARERPLPVAVDGFFGAYTKVLATPKRVNARQGARSRRTPRPNPGSVLCVRSRLRAQHAAEALAVAALGAIPEELWADVLQNLDVVLASVFGGRRTTRLRSNSLHQQPVARVEPATLEA